ncbi:MULTISPECIES: hypothetical protein [unclassified Pseudomonas]|uniref:hypothetical protein n=1 Tax=Pseudomonas TaxID=286 RepID=UPI000C26AEB4|nr:MULTISPECIES: hypothetical protein [unclassified Pseudomonas]PJK36954.1 hypothetical protein CWC49_27855 [Pseudomonas sp. S09F 262]PJK40901.1 hypothetical protein CWC48_17710 [Pseudomonas sp. S10E 269]
MHLIKTYDSQDEANEAVTLLNGLTRVASERDDNTIIYNLFAEPTWANLHKLKMYDLPELKTLLSTRISWGTSELERHKKILQGLERAAKNFNIQIPGHWK